MPALLGAAAFVAVCGFPYLRWWAHPSLFDDDFLRVGSLRRSSLGEALFRPFNEHMAPLFEVVTWLAWIGAGRQVVTIPLAFQVTSYVAFGTMVALLGAWVGRELKSTTAALVAVASISLSAVSAEAVLWFSASSFTWAASATLAACLAASIAIETNNRRTRAGWLILSGLAALAAPAFSAIGILAGPLAALRVGTEVDRPLPTARRLALAVVPLLGSFGYLLICERFQYRELVSASVRQGFDPVAAAWATLRAPAAVLLPGLAGRPEVSGSIPGLALAALSAIALVIALAWASRSRHRPLILVGLGFIAGGYLATYATRARPGDPWIFAIQRYHLFPQIGLVALISTAASPLLRRFDEGPARGFVAGTCLASLLAVVQYPAMKAASEAAFRYPDQPRALAAAGRLEAICGRVGVTLPQAIAALEPIRPAWYPRPWPFNPLLHLLPTGPAIPRVADNLVRATLIEALSLDDRESLFGGMDATRHARPWTGKGEVATARPIEAGQGRDHYLDFSVGPEADRAVALGLSGFEGARSVEIWWAGKGDDWSPYRSVRWEAFEGKSVPFEAMPHWQRGQVRSVRVVARDPKLFSPGVIRFLE